VNDLEKNYYSNF